MRRRFAALEAVCRLRACRARQRLGQELAAIVRPMLNTRTPPKRRATAASSKSFRANAEKLGPHSVRSMKARGDDRVAVLTRIEQAARGRKAMSQARDPSSASCRPRRVRRPRLQALDRQSRGAPPKPVEASPAAGCRRRCRVESCAVRQTPTMIPRPSLSCARRAGGVRLRSGSPTGRGDIAITLAGPPDRNFTDGGCGGAGRRRGFLPSCSGRLCATHPALARSDRGCSLSIAAARPAANLADFRAD